MKEFIKRALHRCGLDVQRCTPRHCPRRRRMHLMAQQRIDAIVDVGANVGQYASALRQEGFGGRIVSIEPQPLAFQQLWMNASRDPLWDCKQVALAESDGEAVLNIAGNSVSSSLLPMTEYMASAFSQATAVAQELVQRTTVESILGEFGLENSQVFLKIDAQGYEEYVLQGARAVLPQIRMIETELPLRAMYQGGSSLTRVVELLSDLNYRMVSVETNTVDPRTEYTVEVNAIFVPSE